MHILINIIHRKNKFLYVDYVEIDVKKPCAIRQGFSLKKKVKVLNV